MVRNYYRRRLRVIVGSSAGPYGFTLATWSAGAVLMSAHGIPSLLAILTFIAGAVVGFGFVGFLAFGGLEKHFDEDHGDPPLVWGSFHLLSVGLAVGAAALVGYLVEGFLTWPVGGFIYTTIYLIAAAFESALAYARDHRGEE
ncbi:MAG TPA: hypothetical protein VHF46_05515 [Rubrobacteraceae bacterium]|nr:hypothetical protein [Rubrobacteraceae bacterium]